MIPYRFPREKNWAKQGLEDGMWAWALGAVLRALGWAGIEGWHVWLAALGDLLWAGGSVECFVICALTVGADLGVAGKRVVLF